MSDLEQIIAGEQPAEPEAEVAAPAEAEAPETEIEAEPAPEVKEPEPKAPEPEFKSTRSMVEVPSALLGQLRSEIRELKETREAKEAPDFFQDPGAAVQHQLKPVQSMVENMRYDISEEMTVEMLNAQGKDGRDIVESAKAALEASQDMAAVEGIRNSRNPYKSLVEWHNRTRVAREIGDDPAAFEARIRERVTAEVKAALVAEQAQAVAAKAAPSLADTVGTGGGPKTTWAGPTPLESAIR